jgi:uncharacterized protein
MPLRPAACEFPVVTGVERRPWKSGIWLHRGRVRGLDGAVVAIGARVLGCRCLHAGRDLRAFLLLPIQVQVLHVPSPEVSPTNLLFNVISAPAGAVAYYRARRLDIPLARALSAGTAPGVIVGALLRSTWLADATRFGIVAAIVLVGLGLRILIDALRPTRPRRPREDLPPLWRLGILFTVAGLVGGVYGIGGAALVVPWLTTVERLPVAPVAGAGLVTTSVTSTIGLATFAVAAATGLGSASPPQWLPGIALGVGGVVGAAVGAQLQPRVPERLLRGVLAVAAIGAGVRMW